MFYFFAVIVIGFLIWMVLRSDRQKQELNEQANMRLYEETDEFFSKKKLFNEAQAPGDLDNSVEKIYYPKRKVEQEPGQELGQGSGLEPGLGQDPGQLHGGSEHDHEGAKLD